MATMCSAAGRKKNGRLRKGYRWAKGRKGCAIKVRAAAKPKRKGKPWSTARKLRQGATKRSGQPMFHPAIMHTRRYGY